MFIVLMVWLAVEDTNIHLVLVLQVYLYILYFSSFTIIKFILIVIFFHRYYSVNPIAQLVEHVIGNLRVDSSSPAMETGRHGPAIYPVATLISGIWATLASCFFITSAYNGSDVILPMEWRWCWNVQIQLVGKVVLSGLAWNNTINHDLSLY